MGCGKMRAGVESCDGKVSGGLAVRVGRVSFQHVMQMKLLLTAFAVSEEEKTHPMLSLWLTSEAWRSKREPESVDGGGKADSGGKE